MNRYVINDTADVIWKRKSDGHLVFTTEAQLASISQAVSEERLFGGIGNKTVAILSTEKTVDLTVRNSLWDLEYLSMTQGVAIESDGTATVKKQEKLTVKDNSGTLELEVTGTPIGDVTVFDVDGTQESATPVTGVVEVPITFTAIEGDELDVIYNEEVTGGIVTFDSETFSEKYEVEYRTIAYDPSTMEVTQDIYIQFDEVKPSGNFEMSFENGTALTPELNFMVTTPLGKTEMGRVIKVARS